jgi:Fic family protein
MELYRLERPALTEGDFASAFKKLLEQKGSLTDLFRSVSTPDYLYWNKIRYKRSFPYLRREELWVLAKLARKSQTIPTPVITESGDSFSWVKFPHYEQNIHELDFHIGGNLSSSKNEMQKAERHKYISKGIMEEAIASSQLEGANTTRKYAKQFLQEGRKAKTKAEQMILNTYETMIWVEQDFFNRPLDLDSLCELHTRIVKKILPAREQGTLRQDSDDIVIQDAQGIVYHVPPRIAFVADQLKRLIAYANNELPGDFVHPVTKAIILHFWLAYLHPFTDGNGRLARILSYWYLLKQGYWAISYLPISKRIRMSSAQYKKAYIYSEQDDFDLSYFIHYNLNKLLLAKSDFESYIKSKSVSNATAIKKGIQQFGLNSRQLELLQYFHLNPERKTTTRIHCTTHQITRATSIADLTELVKLGFLTLTSQGRAFIFFPTSKISELFS